MNAIKTTVNYKRTGQFLGHSCQKWYNHCNFTGNCHRTDSGTVFEVEIQTSSGERMWVDLYDENNEISTVWVPVEVAADCQDFNSYFRRNFGT